MTKAMIRAMLLVLRLTSDSPFALTSSSSHLAATLFRLREKHAVYAHCVSRNALSPDQVAALALRVEQALRAEVTDWMHSGHTIERLSVDDSALHRQVDPRTLETTNVKPLQRLWCDVEISDGDGVFYPLYDVIAIADLLDDDSFGDALSDLSDSMRVSYIEMIHPRATPVREPED